MAVFEWDDAKRRANIAKHGVDFEAAIGFDYDAATTLTYTRNGVLRHCAFGPIDRRLHAVVYTAQRGCDPHHQREKNQCPRSRQDGLTPPAKPSNMRMAAKSSSTKTTRRN